MATYNGTEGNNSYVGNFYTDEIFGLGGNDTLDGAEGSDIIEGGLGDDLLDGNVGVDTASYELAGSGVTVSLSVTGTQATGGAGTDTLSNFENLLGSAFNDILTGNSGANLIQGGAGADMLDGQAGTDMMFGGLGNDTYVVDSVLPANALIMSGEPGDYVSQGLSSLYTDQSGSFTVGSMRDDTDDGVIDWLTLNYSDVSHFWHVDFSTDELGQNLAPGDYTDAQRASFADPGHAGLDVSGDGRGSNQVFGSFTIHEIEIDYSGLSPVLTSFSANFEQHSENALAPALYGSINYNNAGMGELTIELPNQGVDKILSSVTMTLPRNIENLTLTGTSAINGTGNTMANAVTGNNAANILNGFSNADVLKGGSGGDKLFGGAGRDKLTGGLGADKFVFDAALNATSNKDTILDFSSLQNDKIWLDNDIFTKLGTQTSTTNLPSSKFSGDGVAHDSNDYIIYNPSSGTLTYDSNGSLAGGAPTVFAVVGASVHPALAYTDFQIIA